LHTHRLVAFAATLALAGSAAVAGDALASSTSFNYTGAMETYQVPEHVHALSVAAAGAAGGNGIYAGGRGATVSSTLAVTPGSTLYVYVGGNGVGGAHNAGGFNGGGSASQYNSGSSGGGASDIRTAAGDLASRLVVAGGGGGGGSGYDRPAYGGNGGAFDGAAGGGNNSWGHGGGGGTQSAGGSGGWSSVGGTGETGTFGQGGRAGLYFYPPYYGGGAGGGGYYGGGGGGSFSAGGGGSSYSVPEATGTTYGLNLGAPAVTITTQPVTVDAVSYDFGATSLSGQSSHTFTVSNISDTPQQVSFITDGASFSADGCDTGLLAANATCSIIVTFDPSAANSTLGARSGALHIDVDGSPRLSVSLTGTAVDTTPPAAPAITGGPQGTVTDTTARFEFSGEAGATFECALDGGAFELCTSPKTYTGLAVGEHAFEVRQTDGSANIGPSTSQTFTVQSHTTTQPHPEATEPEPDASDLDLVVAKQGTISNKRVPVGCRVDAGQLASCTVKAYAGNIRVGIGSATFEGGLLGSVRVKLNVRGTKLVRRVGGVLLTYRATAKTVTGNTTTAKGSSRVLPLTAAAIPSDGMFAFDSSKFNGYGKRYVRTLSGQLAGANRIRCTGHTDSVGRAAYNQRLGEARAKALCARLRSEGVKAHRTVRSAGERRPRATNRTAAGRALNRRTDLLVRYR
jgi:outer membrane protein OmpA-like peptidoglycan-associated protein